MATERAGAATFQGNGLTLVGDEVKVGDAAPDFSVLGDDLSAVTLADYADKVKVICLVPSLDTPVCDTEIRRFNQEAAGLGDNVAVLAVSADLPFAQKRWCGDAGADNVRGAVRPPRHFPGRGLRRRDQGTAPALSRAVFVIDASDTVRYVEYVTEITEEPDYDAALAAARATV